MPVAYTKGRFAATKATNCRVFAGNPKSNRGISCLDPPAAAGSGIARCRRWNVVWNRILARAESTWAISAGHQSCLLPGLTLRIRTVPANPKSPCSIVRSPGIWKHFSRGSKNAGGMSRSLSSANCAGSSSVASWPADSCGFFAITAGGISCCRYRVRGVRSVRRVADAAWPIQPRTL